MSELRRSYARIAQPNRSLYSRRVTDDGQLESPGSVINMVGDYSDSGLGMTRFWVQPDPDKVMNVSSIHLLISDGGEPGDADYGNITDGLEVGARFFVEREGSIMYADLILKDNIDVLGFSDSFEVTSFSNNVRVLRYRRFFAPNTDDFRVVDDAPSKFGVELNDDFSALEQHMLWINGSQQFARFTGWLAATVVAMLPFIQTGAFA